MSAQGLGSRAIIGSFYNRLEQNAAASWVGRLAMPMDSDQSSETYKWLGMSPRLREWVGGREAKGFRENGFTIVNKTWEATLRVSTDDIRRDKTGQVQVRINELADQAATHDQGLLSTLILNGASGLCYDGQYFFDTDHSEGDSGNQSNSIGFDISDEVGTDNAGTYTNPTPKTMQRAILKAVAQLLSLKDDQGEVLNELARSFDVMVPPSFMGATIAACAAPILEGGMSNQILAVQDFQIRPVVNPRLTAWSDKFAVFRADGNTKPFIVQEEEKLSISAVAEGSEHEFKNNEHLYGIKRISNVGYGMWQHACLVTLAN